MRTTGRILVGALALVALTACGSTNWSQRDGATSSNAPVQLTSVLVKTTDAKTAKFDVHVDISGLGAGSFDASGAVDLEHGNAEVNGNIASAHVEERVVDGVAYVKLPFGGDTWLKIDAKKFGAGASTLAPLGGSDPNEILSYLKKVATDVHEVGHESVGGVDTTHYAATVGQIPIDVWVDAEGRLRKETVSIDISGIKANVTLELHDFGTPVNVVAPPPDQIETLGGLFGG